MSRRRGRRYDDTPKLNIKKVIATIIAIIVIIMFSISLKKLLSGEKKEKIKEVSSLTTYITVYKDNKWGVIDNKGNVIIDTSYEEMIIIPDKNKDLFICTYDIDYDNQSYKTKVLNSSGKEILTNYEMVEPLENSNNNEIWYESDILKYQENGKYGLINYEGKEILPAEYDNIYCLSGIEKSIIIEKNGKKGLVSNSIGEIIIPVEYADIISLTDTYENGYIVKNESGKYGVIGTDKQTVLEDKYDEIKRVTGNNLYVVVQNSKLEIVKNTGEVILDNGYDSVEAIDGENFIIIKNSKYGVINKLGDSVINSEYEDIKFCFSNYYIAKKNGKYGVIDTNGNEIIAFNYENMSYIKSANFIEAENSDYTTDIINKDFNKVLESVIISELNLEDGYIRIRKDADYKYYNFKFEEMNSKEVLATNTLFLVKENGKYGYENKNGDRIVDCIYDDAKEQNEFGYCSVKKDGLWGSLKSDGTVVLEPIVNLDDYLYIDFISDWYKFNDSNLNIYTK